MPRAGRDPAATATCRLHFVCMINALRFGHLTVGSKQPTTDLSKLKIPPITSCGTTIIVTISGSKSTTTIITTTTIPITETLIIFTPIFLAPHAGTNRNRSCHSALGL
mmetsp:Transcript_29228/g.64048  ORF Transcript_29228/g.64048 Transcript_29228/m.64048 type:complete len:108 (-) Transcript_29228:1161-1484(-)